MHAFKMTILWLLGSALIVDSCVHAMPMVETNDKPDGKNVNVHVPLVYDMQLNKNNKTGNTHLDMTVLSGLVHVFRNRTRDQSGRFTGPIEVSIFGVPIYTNGKYHPPTPLSPDVFDKDAPIVVPNEPQTRQAPDDMLRNAGDFLQRLASDVINRIRPSRPPVAIGDTLSANQINTGETILSSSRAPDVLAAAPTSRT